MVLAKELGTLRDVVARTPFFSRLPDPSLSGEGEVVQGYYRVDAMCRLDHYRPALPKVHMPNRNGFIPDPRPDVR